MYKKIGMPSKKFKIITASCYGKWGNKPMVKGYNCMVQISKNVLYENMFKIEKK